MNTETKSTSFVPRSGAVREFHHMVRPCDVTAPFDRQLDSVIGECCALSRGCSAHFLRFFLSDAANQMPALESRLGQLPRETAISIVQQRPLDGAKVEAWLYCTDPFETGGKGLSHNGRTHRWDACLTSEGEGSFAQMDGIFNNLDRTLAREGMSVASSTVRTWIFVRDVDVNYQGVVAARRIFFERIGLTPQTHYVASTGIEGSGPDCSSLVRMDAYSVDGLAEGQVRYLQAPDHLNLTYEYGVTFERGTAVTYGDRKHVFISGTASIDSHGEVLHKGDAAAQTSRLIDNVAALLSDAGTSLGDIAAAVVYLRDPSDYATVKGVVESAVPLINAVYVHAPVCRPTWLVEMECIALKDEGNPGFENF